MEELFPMAGKILHRKTRLYMVPVKANTETANTEPQTLVKLSRQLPVRGVLGSMAC